METYLVHHGILGQKWGVRRYQNPDGTLTAEGKRRQRAEDKLYREKSLKKVDKYYNENYHYGAYGLMNKQGIKTLKQRIAIEEDKVTKRDLKLALKYNEKLKDLEKEKVSKLTHNQIMNERKIAGKAYMKAVGATVASSIALPGISWVIVLPSPQKDLSYNRVSEKERTKVLEDLKPKNYKGNLATYKNAEKKIRRKKNAESKEN